MTQCTDLVDRCLGDYNEQGWTKGAGWRFDPAQHEIQ
jgi:hypothetical protein